MSKYWGYRRFRGWWVVHSKISHHEDEEWYDRKNVCWSQETRIKPESQPHMSRWINAQEIILNKWVNSQLPVIGGDKLETFFSPSGRFQRTESPLRTEGMRLLPFILTFSLSLNYTPTFLLLLPGIIWQGTYLHPIPCLSLCHQSNKTDLIVVLWIQ